jgi:hypothetical protein
MLCNRQSFWRQSPHDDKHPQILQILAARQNSISSNGPSQQPVLAEECHPCRDQRVSPNNSRVLFILSDGSSNGWVFSASTGETGSIWSAKGITQRRERLIPERMAFSGQDRYPVENKVPAPTTRHSFFRNPRPPPNRFIAGDSSHAMGRSVLQLVEQIGQFLQPGLHLWLVAQAAGLVDHGQSFD